MRDIDVVLLEEEIAMNSVFGPLKPGLFSRSPLPML
jgi:hypothetical protein